MSGPLTEMLKAGFRQAYAEQNNEREWECPECFHIYRTEPDSCPFCKVMNREEEK